MKRNVDSNIVDYPSDTHSQRALDVADRAETLARELLSLPQNARRQAVEAFINRDWKSDEIKSLLSSVSIRILRRLIQSKLSRPTF